MVHWEHTTTHTSQSEKNARRKFQVWLNEGIEKVFIWPNAKSINLIILSLQLSTSHTTISWPSFFSLSNFLLFFSLPRSHSRQNSSLILFHAPNEKQAASSLSRCGFFPQFFFQTKKTFNWQFFLSLSLSLSTPLAGIIFALFQF